MDIVSTVPLCGVLISGVHASPLGMTANQTSAPLLVAGPSFPPVTQGPIDMLPGVSISHSGTPGMQIATSGLYSSIQSVSAPPALYNGGYSTGAPPPAPPSAVQSASLLPSAAFQPMTGMQWPRSTPYLMSVPLWPLHLGLCTCLTLVTCLGLSLNRLYYKPV